MGEHSGEHKPGDKCPICRVSPCYCDTIVEPRPGDEISPEWDDEFIRREEAAERKEASDG